jgi:type I restriction enzyme S subunit
MNERLPKGWASASLSEVAEINPRHPKGLDDSMPVSFAPMAAISESRPEFNFLEERNLGTVRKGFTHFAEGDVLFAKITPCMENGKAAIASGLRNGLGCGTTELHVLRPRDGVSPKYLYHYVHQDAFRREAARNFTGTAGQLRVPVSFIRDAVIPVPPVDEQRRIATKLELLLAKLTACQRRLAGIQQILARFRQAVLAAACSGRLTADWRQNISAPSVLPVSEMTHTEDVEDLPDGWIRARVGDVIENLKYGTAQKCGYENRGAPVLRIPNVANGSIDHADLKYAELPPNELQQLRLYPGDILLIRSNGSVSLVGKCAVVREKERGFAYAGYLIRLRPKLAIVEPDFLSLALGNYDVRLQIELEARSTSGVNNINGDEVRALCFSLPPLAEQHEITRRVQELFTLADRIEARYRKAQTQVDKLTQSILARAFQGKLVEQNPADEPASNLLERINAARLALASSRAKRKAVSPRGRFPSRRREKATV